MSEADLRQKFINYFKHLSHFNSKTFDTHIKYAIEYADEYGLTKEDLITITANSFKQKLGAALIKKTIRCLIPRTYVPDIAVQIVLEWLLMNYNQKVPGLSIKAVLQWLVGLIEYNLSNADIINNYYQIYYYLLETYVEPTASKLIYLLTKPSDINRSVVKQVLRIHRINGNEKHTGAILYIFKMYRPDCVPERIPACSVHSSFRKLPLTMTEGFKKAVERINRNSVIQTSADKIIWIKPESHRKIRKKNADELIPNIASSETHFGYSNGKKSLLSVTNVNELFKYHVSSSHPHRVISLLLNTAGYHILAFSDRTTKVRFSYQLYFLLNDAFLECNPNITYEEKDELLKWLSVLQINMQQGIPVVSKFLGEYIARWDGLSHERNIYSLLEWLYFHSYSELYDCILESIYDLYISSCTETKCNILNFLGNLAVNIIMTYKYQRVNEIPYIFLERKADWDFDDLISNLYDFIITVCKLGIYLDQNNFIIYNVIQLNFKIILAESRTNINIWRIPTFIPYSAFMSHSPNPLRRMCDIYTRFPSSLDDCVKADFINCLVYNQAFEPLNKDSIFYICSKKKRQFSNALSISKSCFNMRNHFAFACCNYELFGTNVHDNITLYRNMQNKYVEVFNFIVKYGLNKKRKKR